ncbi:MAG: HipA domain-containing protein [Rikenellaceae bacterium]
MNRCLYCYAELGEGEVDFHPRCSRKIFGKSKPPILPYSRDDISTLAEQVIRSQTTLTGVQSKLSLSINRGARNEPARFTIVGLWGDYILKPQSDMFTLLPEVEDLTMHLATIAGVDTVPHTLLRFADGELCYLTKRIDRTTSGEKLPMEDMCQLSERLTEHKYKGSYERIAKKIAQYATASRLDVVNFWEQVIFSWITGNADMHLKNFSLYSPTRGLQKLTPAYDLLSTALVMPEDSEELALTLNSKKRRIKRSDFVIAMQNSDVDDKTIAKSIAKFVQIAPKWYEFIDISFLSEEMKSRYKEIICCKIAMLETV